MSFRYLQKSIEFVFYNYRIFIANISIGKCYIAKTKNTKARKNFNNYIENKEVKGSNNWVCINVLTWNQRKF